MSERPVDLVLFDAVGTLIYPDPPVAEVYFNASQKGRGGGGISREEIAARFKAALKQSYSLQTIDNLGETSEDYELERWLQIVSSVFWEWDEVGRVGLFNELWQTFSEPGHWRVFPEVEATVRELRQRGYACGVASNFDQRLLGICRFRESLSQLDPIFVSSVIGWSKPAMGFYREIERRSGFKPERILLVGDDPENDFAAARRCGWQSRWLTRDADSTGERIRTLTELLDQLPG